MLHPRDLDDYIDGKVRAANRVLAVGETNMDFSERYAKRLDEWRIPRIAKLNPRVIGIDIVRKNVELARKHGYDFRFANIERKAELQRALGKQRFDVILLLDVIEHLSNTVAALENLRDILTPEGEIIVTTDSPFYFRQFLNRLVGLKVNILDDHTSFVVPEHMLQLCKRTGLLLASWDSIHSVRNNWLTRMFSAVVKAWHPYFLDHFVYVVRLPGRGRR